MERHPTCMESILLGDPDENDGLSHRHPIRTPPLPQARLALLCHSVHSFICFKPILSLRFVSCSFSCMFRPRSILAVWAVGDRNGGARCDGLVVESL